METTNNSTEDAAGGDPRPPEADVGPGENGPDAPEAAGQKKDGAASSQSKPAKSGPEKAEEDGALDRAFLAKVAVYADGLSAGLGIKILNRDVLLGELSEPDRREPLRSRVIRHIEQAISDADVSYGVDGEAVAGAAEAFLAAVEQGSEDMVARKVAEGEPPEPGEDACLEYPLNPDNQPMHRVTGVAPTSRKRWYHMVRKGETLVQLLPAKPGTPGQGVTGGQVEPKKPKEVSLTSVIGENTEVEGDRLIAGCEGACEENARGRVRVVPEVVVEAVDASTGNLPEAGVSKASILVKRDIKSGHGVSSSENVFVGVGSAGGIVEQRARVTANNLVVNGAIFGGGETGSADGDPETVDVQEVCVAREIEGRSVAAGKILVVGDCRLAQLDADDVIRVDGDLLGGRTICRQVLTVGGSMGSSEGSTRTRVVVPPSGDVTRRKKRLDVAVRKQKGEIEELQAKLNQLDAAAAKRTKSDAYWATLLSGEYRKPGNSVEANTLRQFRDLLNAKKTYERSLADVRQALAQLQEQVEEADGESDTSETFARVGGSLNLDVEFEVTLEVPEEAMESQITYVIEGKRFRNHMLSDIRAELTKQVKAYLEGQSAHVEERRQAIDKMFEGAEKRPTGPQVQHKRFELAFTWSDDDSEGEAGGDFQIAATAIMDTLEPNRLRVRTVAKLRKALQAAEVKISQDGPRARFSAGSCSASQVCWKKDPELQQELDAIVLRGVSANRALDGVELPEEPGAGTQ